MSKQQIRLEQLEKHFTRSFPNINHHKQLQVQELQNVLDRMCGEAGFQAYDQDIFEELVEKVQQEGQPLTIKSFLNVYIEAEDVLTLKSEHVDQSCQKMQQSTRYLEDMVNELNKRSHQNNNVSDNQASNQLILEQIQIQNLRNPQGYNCQPYLEFQIKDYFTNKTQHVLSNSPTFDLRGFQLPVHSLVDQLKITVIDRQLEQHQPHLSEYGQIELAIDALPFFQNKTIKYSLVKDGAMLNTEISITCHLQINDIPKAVNDLKQKCAFFWGRVDDILQDKKILEEQISQLQQPFNSDLNFQPNNNHIPSLYEENMQQNNQNYMDNQRNMAPNQDVYEHNSNYINNNNNNNNNNLMQRNPSQPEAVNRSNLSEQNFGNMQNNNNNNNGNNEQFRGNNNNLIEKPSYEEQMFHDRSNQFLNEPVNEVVQPAQQYQPTQFAPQQQFYNNGYNEDDDDADCMDISRYLKETHVLALVWIILAGIQCIKRPMFFDILIGVVFQIFLLKNKTNPQNYKQLLQQFAIATGCTILLDIFWMIFYVKGWHLNETSVDEGQQSFIRGIVIFLAFITLFWKFGVIGSYFIYIYQQPEKIMDLQTNFKKNLENTVMITPKHTQIQQGFNNQNQYQDNNNNNNNNHSLSQHHNNNDMFLQQSHQQNHY